jgi:membrane peptidoglycan carboxypeptidase
LTLQIEQEYSKEEILEIYFNLVYLGHGTTGLSSAANVYFSKDVRDLDIAEGAMLARLLSRVTILLIPLRMVMAFGYRKLHLPVKL